MEAVDPPLTCSAKGLLAHSLARALARALRRFTGSGASALHWFGRFGAGRAAMLPVQMIPENPPGEAGWVM